MERLAQKLIIQKAYHTKKRHSFAKQGDIILLFNFGFLENNMLAGAAIILPNLHFLRLRPRITLSNIKNTRTFGAQKLHNNGTTFFCHDGLSFKQLNRQEVQTQPLKVTQTQKHFHGKASVNQIREYHQIPSGQELLHRKKGLTEDKAPVIFKSFLFQRCKIFRRDFWGRPLRIPESNPEKPVRPSKSPQVGKKNHSIRFIWFPGPEYAL